MADRIDMEDNERLPSSQGTAQPHWGRRALTLLIGLAAIGGFAMVVVYSYNQSAETAAEKKAPIITAEKGPTKVRPESPGGMSVPNQDKQVYGQIDSARMPEKVERLLPPPESVIAPPPPPSTDTASSAPPAPPERMSEEEKVARDIAAIEPSAGKEKPSASPAAKEPATQMAAKPPEPATAPEQKTRAPAAPEPVPEKTAAATPPSQKTASLKSSWRIQIASLRSEDAAKSAWTRLSKKNSDLFGKLEHQIVRIELAGKGTFYRLQAGPLTDATSAKELCSRVKQRKIGCLVVRP